MPSPICMFIFIQVFIHSKIKYCVPDIILGAYNIQEGKPVEGFQVVTGKQTVPFCLGQHADFGIKPDLCLYPMSPRALKETSKSFLPIDITLSGHGATTSAK